MSQDQPKLKEGNHIVEGGDCQVHIVMGSASDLPVAKKAIKILEEFEVKYAVTVASAHRTPQLVEDTVKGSGARVFIAIAGLSAALPGVIAAHTQMPVIGVPVASKMTLDAILSIVQMPPGIPVGAVGLDRGDNAALLSIRILASSDASMVHRLDAYLENMRKKVIRSGEEVLG